VVIFIIIKINPEEIVNEIDVNPKYLSQIINTELNKNFYDFVNEYRIEYAKQELLSIKNTNLTILAIGENCGFNSKLTLNDVFKKFTSHTPSEFIKNNS
jgi:YesN/AraC family two-component response regulator